MERGTERRFSDFALFLGDLMRELNAMSAEGWVVLVEGMRDAAALRSLGYEGRLITVAASAKRGRLDVGGAQKVVLLTDLDAEGGRMGSRFSRMLAAAGVETSLHQRRRLLAASKGVFRHIENLSRFGASAAD